MVGQWRSSFCIVLYHEHLRTWIKAKVNKFATESHTVLILGILGVWGYLKLTCALELHTLPNTKVITVKDHDENYSKGRPSLVCHLFRNRLLFDHSLEVLPWIELPPIHFQIFISYFRAVNSLELNGRI